MILLTRAGIEEMERSRGAPDQATEHFSPISVIHIQGDAIGSAIQAGSPRAHQTVSIGDLNLDTVREIVGELEAQAASLHLPDDGARQLRADMATVKAQIDLPTPDHYTSVSAFSRRVRSSNTPEAERRPPASWICFGPCIFEGTKRLIATRVHDRSGRAKVPVVVRQSICRRPG